MLEINIERLMELSFGTKVWVIWDVDNPKYNEITWEEDEKYKGVVFGERIGYTDGVVDDIERIADCMSRGLCKVYIDKSEFVWN